MTEERKRKLKWEKEFQNWCDRQLEADTDFCGSSQICDYCNVDGHDKPCVSALHEFLNETGETVDYDENTFEEVWDL